VQIPARLSRKGKELLEELRGIEGENAEPQAVKLSEVAGA